MDAPVTDSCIARDFTVSPNHGERAAGSRIDCILLHYTGLRTEALDDWTRDPGGEALRWLCEPQSQVSCHYIVDRDGHVTQLVPEERRAWHAGRGAWKGCTDINSCSIGIEIVNAGHAGGLPPYPDMQIHAVIALCKDIIARRGIPAERILAHSDIAPDRKADPGEHFPWDALHRAGVGIWVDAVCDADGVDFREGDMGDDVLLLQQKLARVGYDISATGLYDERTKFVVRAFQRRYRQARVDDIADASTRATLDALLAALSATGDQVRSG
jgi:N-acetylmuramoyl-L-alanine amidase